MRDYDIEDWADTFKPITNHLSNNASWDGIMFETYGDELDFVLKSDESKVWTYMDGEEGGTILCAGYHLANRIGYFITAIAREPDLEDMSNHICITVSEPSEDE